MVDVVSPSNRRSFGLDRMANIHRPVPNRAPVEAELATYQHLPNERNKRNPSA